LKKIILDCDLMRHPNSGLYHYCLNLGNEVQGLIDEVAAPMQMNYYVPKEEKNAFLKKQHCIIEKPKFHKIAKPFLWDCDIWHAPFQSGRMIPAPNKKLKIVLTIHDLNPLHEGKPVAEQKNSLAHTQLLIDKTDVIICISEFTKNDVLANCNVGNKPIHVIYHGIHKVHPAIENATVRKSARPFLFGMGYVNAKKNYHVLLPLLESNPGLDIVIAGRLDELDYISAMQATAARQGVADRLHITGPVSESDKAWYLQNCLAFVHPSLAEGFGAPIVEAMQFGKPLFLSNLTSLPEVGADVAYYFTSFDACHMQSVFKEGMQHFEINNIYERVIQRGKEFNWKESAKKYLDVYQSLL
jgi:glycosyltransferase involved in cell wall biosynthesis